MKLTPIMERFILHWGEMGWRWGINRSVAQVHALLMLSPKPLPADEIGETLNVARSNVSTSLKELNGWGLVRTVHVFGDRREHFETLRDVWEMFLVIMRERKKRELDPTLATLRECAAEAKANKADTDYTAARSTSWPASSSWPGAGPTARKASRPPRPSGCSNSATRFSAWSGRVLPLIF
jgi:DNA-binding transcriptional regulator GbsR (MarR family)